MTVLPPDPRLYRRRASRIAERAKQEPDPRTQRALLDEALAWIALAEQMEIQSDAPSVLRRFATSG